MLHMLHEVEIGQLHVNSCFFPCLHFVVYKFVCEGLRAKGGTKISLAMVYICVSKGFHGAFFMFLFHHYIGLGSIRMISKQRSLISHIILWNFCWSTISIPSLVDFWAASSQLVETWCYCEGIYVAIAGGLLWVVPLCGCNLLVMKSLTGAL